MASTPTYTPPAPISPVFNDNIDVLIQQLLENKNGVTPLNPLLLMQRYKNAESVIYEILERLKFLNSGVESQSDWLQTDITAPDYIKNKPVINDSNIDGGFANSTYLLSQVFDGGGA